MSKLDTNQIHLNNNVADLRQHQLRAAAKNTWRLIFPDISGDLFAGNTINNKNIQTHATIFLQRLFPPLGESLNAKTKRISQSWLYHDGSKRVHQPTGGTTYGRTIYCRNKTDGI